MSAKHKQESPQAVMMVTRNVVRPVFQALERELAREEEPLTWRHVYAVCDVIIDRYQAELARQGRGGRRWEVSS